MNTEWQVVDARGGRPSPRGVAIPTLANHSEFFALVSGDVLAVDESEVAQTKCLLYGNSLNVIANIDLSLVTVNQQAILMHDVLLLNVDSLNHIDGMLCLPVRHKWFQERKISIQGRGQHGHLVFGQWSTHG